MLRARRAWLLGGEACLRVNSRREAAGLTLALAVVGFAAGPLPLAVGW